MISSAASSRASSPTSSVRSETPRMARTSQSFRVPDTIPLDMRPARYGKGTRAATAVATTDGDLHTPSVVKDEQQRKQLRYHGSATVLCVTDMGTDPARVHRPSTRLLSHTATSLQRASHVPVGYSSMAAYDVRRITNSNFVHRKTAPPIEQVVAQVGDSLRAE